MVFTVYLDLFLPSHFCCFHILLFFMQPTVCNSWGIGLSPFLFYPLKIYKFNFCLLKVTPEILTCPFYLMESRFKCIRTTLLEKSRILNASTVLSFCRSRTLLSDSLVLFWRNIILFLRTHILNFLLSIPPDVVLSIWIQSAFFWSTFFECIFVTQVGWWWNSQFLSERKFILFCSHSWVRWIWNSRLTAISFSAFWRDNSPECWH